MRVPRPCVAGCRDHGPWHSVYQLFNAYLEHAQDENLAMAWFAKTLACAVAGLIVGFVVKKMGSRLEKAEANAVFPIKLQEGNLILFFGYEAGNAILIFLRLFTHSIEKSKISYIKAYSQEDKKIRKNFYNPGLLCLNRKKCLELGKIVS